MKGRIKLVWNTQACPSSPAFASAPFLKHFNPGLSFIREIDGFYKRVDPIRFEYQCFLARMFLNLIITVTVAFPVFFILITSSALLWFTLLLLCSALHRSDFHFWKQFARVNDLTRTPKNCCSSLDSHSHLLVLNILSTQFAFTPLHLYTVVISIQFHPGEDPLLNLVPPKAFCLYREFFFATVAPALLIWALNLITSNSICHGAAQWCSGLTCLTARRSWVQSPGLCMQSVHALLVPWVSFGYSGFLLLPSIRSTG